MKTEIKAGDRFGALTIVSIQQSVKGRKGLNITLKCDCGRTFRNSRSHFLQHRRTSCSHTCPNKPPRTRSCWKRIRISEVKMVGVLDAPPPALPKPFDTGEDRSNLHRAVKMLMHDYKMTRAEALTYARNVQASLIVYPKANRKN